MTYFKKILTIIVLFSIGVAHAKQIGKKETMPAPTPIPVIPRTQPTRTKAFEQLYNDIKHAKNAWDYKTQLLNDVFVKQLEDDAQAANLNEGQLDFLFLLARDCHAQFIGLKKDIDILHDLEEQRKTIISTF